jgi:hypothetical protein
MTPPVPELHLDPETAFFILLKAREFHAKVAEVDPDAGSNPSDDRSIDVLEFQPDDTVQDELFAAIGALDEDARRDLVALIGLGRGDFELADWTAARAAPDRIDPDHVADEILGTPGVSDDLQEGLSRFGFALGDFLNSGFAATRDLLIGA